MLQRVKIWSVHLRPLRKLACSCLSRCSTASENRLMMSLARILLGQTEGWLLSSCYSCSGLLSFRNFKMTPSVQSSESSGSFFFHILLQRVCCKLWFGLEEFCVEAVLSRGFPGFEGSDACHDSFFLWHLGQYQDPVLLLQLLVVVCSELRWNVLPILPPALLPYWVAFPLYPQSACCVYSEIL